MDPQIVFCPNTNCLASGQIGKGNIHVHSHQEQCYRCDVCGKTFAATKGTPFYRAHKPPEEVVLVMTLLAPTDVHRKRLCMPLGGMNER